MDQEEDLLGFGEDSEKTAKGGNDSLTAKDTVDLFSSLASRHSIDNEQSALEFDPFASDHFGNTEKEKDPFDLNTITTPTLTDIKPISRADKADDDFADLLNFDSNSVLTPPTTNSKPAEIEILGSATTSAGLFSDFDPLFNSSSPPKANSAEVRSALSATPEDDPFDVKPVTEKTPGKPDSTDIFESMKLSASDPFSADPFTSGFVEVDNTRPMDDEQKPNQNGDAWLESLTKPAHNIETDETKLEPANQDEVSLDETSVSTNEVTASVPDVMVIERKEEESPVILPTTSDKAEAPTAKSQDSVDFSVIEETDHLDVDASKQRSNLRKKGSLALRRKPSRKGVRDSLLTVFDQYSDHTEPRKEAAAEDKEVPEDGAGIKEKHDAERPEIENKPSRVERSGVLGQGGPRPPPGGQMLIPGLADINKVKLRTNPVKPVDSKPKVPVGGATTASSSSLTQPVAVPRIQLRSSQRSSLALPKSDKPPTSAGSKRASYSPLFNKPQLPSKPSLTPKPKVGDLKEATAGVKNSGKPAWLRDAKEAKMATGVEELSAKHKQEAKPEKPAWMKASMEKRLQTTEPASKESEVKSNKENNIPTIVSNSKVTDIGSEKSVQEGTAAENRLNQLNYLQKQKSSSRSSLAPSKGDMFIESSLAKTSHNRLCVSDFSLNKREDVSTTSKNGHTTESLKKSSEDKEEVVMRRPKQSPRPDYIPSWAEGSRVLPAQPGDSGSQSTTDLPKWKRDLLEKRKSKPVVSSQPPTPVNESAGEDTNVPQWRKELQNRRRSSIKQKEVVSETAPSTQPEWMRKAEERRARMAKASENK